MTKKIKFVNRRPSWSNSKYALKEIKDSGYQYKDIEEDVVEMSYETDKEGYVYPVRKVKKVPISQRYEGLRAADFSLQNMIAIGAVGSLKPMNYVGDVDKSLENINILMDEVQNLDAISPNVNVPKIEESIVSVSTEAVAE